MTHTPHVRRTAVVTGAARGIGAAVARRLAGDGLAVGVIDLDGAERLGLSFEEYRRRAEQSIPVGRVGLPDDIAHTASFLVSPGAGFVSGQVIYVAGGPVD